ncbi:efflux RND transporter periplasmic adaptor subunit [Pseudomonadota bacterium AL_CKDN230030165-1A_HGKHYDSX7]
MHLEGEFRFLRGIASLLVVALVGCGDRQPEAGAGPPPAFVALTTVEAESASVDIDLPGRIVPIRSAEVRARVDGIVQKLLYTEGSDVEEGAPLFQIDDSDYRAQLAQARAMLQRAQAVQQNAQSVVNRFRPLVKRQAVSAQEFEAAVAALGQAQAGVTDAQAAVTLATLRLERCVVRAPIAGRVGRALVSEGALVSAGAATLLAQVNQLSPISATFPKSNTAILDLTDEVQGGGLRVNDGNRFPVQLTLANGRPYDEVGYVDFADLTVDPGTGAQTVRARFENADRVLLPGQFVTARMQVGERANTLWVPLAAVQLNAENASLYVVGPDDVAQPRRVTVGAQLDGRWEIRDGLNAGERIIVEGWHKVRPGQRVQQAGAGAGAPR